jgi:hypothetical protein
MLGQATKGYAEAHARAAGRKGRFENGVPITLGKR